MTNDDVFKIFDFVVYLDVLNMCKMFETKDFKNSVYCEKIIVFNLKK